jgi:hypothetical protein
LFSDNGKILLNNLDYAQITAGVLAPLLKTPKTKYAHLTDPWLDSHRVFLDECDAKIIIGRSSNTTTGFLWMQSLPGVPQPVKPAL